jgi:hypothetical protein
MTPVWTINTGRHLVLTSVWGLLPSGLTYWQRRRAGNIEGRQHELDPLAEGRFGRQPPAVIHLWRRRLREAFSL